jgi:NMD protein affecting ribosome stability and mRNA decay
MKTKQRRCLKCGRPISGTRWLCQSCRAENRQIATEAEGVSDLYTEDDKVR